MMVAPLTRAIRLVAVLVNAGSPKNDSNTPPCAGA
jgi:hypothetical protein